MSNGYIVLDKKENVPGPPGGLQNSWEIFTKVQNEGFGVGGSPPGVAGSTADGRPAGAGAGGASSQAV